MPLGGDENAVGIFRVHDDRGNLLRVAKPEMRPRFSGISGVVKSVAGGQVRALQSFAAAHINNVRVGRRDRESADGTAGLLIENGIPRAAKIVGLPHAAVYRGHIKNVGLMQHAGDRHSAAAAKWPDAAPPHFGKERRIILLSPTSRGGGNAEQNQSDQQKSPYECECLHPPPPRELASITRAAARREAG